MALWPSKVVAGYFVSVTSLNDSTHPFPVRKVQETYLLFSILYPQVLEEGYDMVSEKLRGYHFDFHFDSRG